jgi:hypothetical protein
MLPVKVFGLGPEKWVKYTCRGPVTPKGKVPIIYKDVMVAHFRITADGVPSAKQLYELNAPRFQAVSDLCSERRWQQTDRSGWTGNAGHTSYLDWETDLLYERYIISSVEFNPEFARRGIGSPCDESVSCLQVRNGKQRIGCNSVTNTCEAMGLEEVKVLNQSPE